MMYDELIKRLRYCSEETSGCGLCALSDNCVLRVGLILQAADAIEELSMKLHGDEAAIAGMKREIERMVVADKPRWIPVTERLPEQNGKYLAFTLEEENTMDFYDGHWMLYGTDYRRYVTHWMPLPLPPKEDKL